MLVWLHPLDFRWSPTHSYRTWTCTWLSILEVSGKGWCKVQVGGGILGIKKWFVVVQDLCKNNLDIHGRVLK
jgi:hypothetical protein